MTKTMKEAREAVSRLRALAADHDVPPTKLLPVDELVNPDVNPNVMPQDQFDRLVAAIREVGFLQPVLVREVPAGIASAYWEIVDGVHRVRAAKELGYETVPCVTVVATRAEALALQVGMNRMRGELNLASVAVSMGELSAAGWSAEDMQLTGFSMGEVTDLLATLKTSDEDDLGGAVGGSDDGSDPAPKPFELVLTFGEKRDLSRAKRLLKREGGGDLAAGLLAILDDLE